MNDFIYRLSTQIRQSKVLRILVSPYKKYERKRLYQQYYQSQDRIVIEKLKDSHRGERCFIIGNGPSLRAEDLELLKDEYTFAANRIYEIFDQTSWRPTVYLAIDIDFLRAEHQKVWQIQSDLKLLNFNWYQAWHKKGGFQKSKDIILIWIGPKSFEVDKIPIWADKSARIPEDLSKGFSEGRTVTFDAIQMAIHMGFTEIYLLGVDFNYSRVLDENGRIQNIDGVTDYFTKKKYDTTIMCYVPTQYAYIVSREYCDAHGIKIYNATRGGKLETFERVDFDKIFGGGERWTVKHPASHRECRIVELNEYRYRGVAA